MKKTLLLLLIFLNFSFLNFNENLKNRYNFLNNNSALKFKYSYLIKDKIDFYSKDSYFKKVFGLYLFYKPMIENEFTKNNIPKELGIIAILESMMNPKANSSANAKGLWQFIDKTGNFYNLYNKELENDFFNPYKSTKSASLLLGDLYRNLKDWNLVLASYNYGIGNIKKLIRIHKTKNINILINHLPKETKNYLYKFYALRYLLNFGNYHYLYPKHLKYNYLDVVHIPFKNLPKKYINDKWFKFLNPQMKYKYTNMNSLVYFIP